MCLSDESVSGVMQIEDSEREVFGVAISVGAMLDEFDLIVDPLQGTGRDRVVVPGQQTASRIFSMTALTPRSSPLTVPST